jgi:hypothetical protein
VKTILTAIALLFTACTADPPPTRTESSALMSEEECVTDPVRCLEDQIANADDWITTEEFDELVDELEKMPGSRYTRNCSVCAGDSQVCAQCCLTIRSGHPGAGMTACATVESNASACSWFRTGGPKPDGWTCEVHVTIPW